MGDYDRALADFDKALELDSNLTAALANRARAYEVQGDFQKALADRTKAVELAPQDAGALAGLAYTKFDAGNFREASADLARSLELKDNIYATLFRYLARRRIGEHLASQELEASSRHLKSKDWPYAIVELYLGTRPPAQALEAASKPEQQCEAQFYAAQWYILRNAASDAEPLLRKAVGSCPATFIEYTAANAELKRLGR